MASVYDAILDGDRLEWQSDQPDRRQGRLRVQVVVMDPPTPAPSDGSRMAEALEKLARLNAFPDVTDPVQWQRELRADRPMPGRGE
jgi:hypothetical protein